MQELKFEQRPLFSGGHRLLTVELTLHMDGTSDQVEVGYSIKDPGAESPIELGTLGVIGQRSAVPALAVVLTELMMQAEKHLSPFG